MNTTTRRVTVCGGALVITLGAGLVLAPTAQAVAPILSGIVSTPPAAQSSGGIIGGTGSVVGTTLGQGADVLSGSTTGQSTGGVISGTIDSATGSGGLIGGGSGITSGSGGATVGDGSGGTLVSVTLGGTATGSGAGNGAGTGTGSGGGSTTVNNTTTTSTATPAPVPSSSVAVTPSLLRLDATPSVSTVYPVKDGYRDDVVFRLRSVTSTGKAIPVTGTAVLLRGSKTIARWTLTRSSQDLRWNGRDNGKLVKGSHRLVASMKDATGAVHSAVATVTASPQRLVATTKLVQSLAVDGVQQMAAEPRAGLSKGVVTVRLRILASGVQGTQHLIFEKNGKRLVVPIKNGVTTSKAISIPTDFTSFRIRHTWKKGSVKVKKIEYTYSYNSLR